MNTLKRLLLATTSALALVAAAQSVAGHHEAGEAMSEEPDKTVVAEGTWTKGNYKIAGAWKIIEKDGKRKVVLGDDFKTRNAPDLKIFLSPLPLAEIGDRNALKGAVLVSPLDRAKGAQSYDIGSDVELGDYQTVIIHCERFSKYWGGAALKTGRE